MKYQRYVSFDLDTKGKEYKLQHYKQIRAFFIKNGFSPLKDSNYLSMKKLSEADIRKINSLFVAKFPFIIDSLNKYDWTIIKPDSISHYASKVKQIKKSLEQKRGTIRK